MSTIAFAALTTRRNQVAKGAKDATLSPDVKSYVDMVAALVPAEVLTVHAMILSLTTTTTTGTTGDATTAITDPAALKLAFWGLVVLSVVLYVVPRFRTRDRLDLGRVLIPPAAFVAWTMLQRATAFDAVWPSLGNGTRTVFALLLAVLLGVVAAAFAIGADKKPTGP
jgi:hypothetical protein